MVSLLYTVAGPRMVPDSPGSFCSRMMIPVPVPGSCPINSRRILNWIRGVKKIQVVGVSALMFLLLLVPFTAAADDKEWCRIIP